MARRKAPRIPDALLDQPLADAELCARLQAALTAQLSDANGPTGGATTIRF